MQQTEMLTINNHIERLRRSQHNVRVLKQSDSVQKTSDNTYFFIVVREIWKIVGKNHKKSSRILLHSVFEPVDGQVFHLSHDTFPQKR